MGSYGSLISQSLPTAVLPSLSLVQQIMGGSSSGPRDSGGAAGGSHRVRAMSPAAGLTRQVGWDGGGAVWAVLDGVGGWSWVGDRSSWGGALCTPPSLGPHLQLQLHQRCRDIVSSSDNIAGHCSRLTSNTHLGEDFPCHSEAAPPSTSLPPPLTLHTPTHARTGTPLRLPSTGQPSRRTHSNKLVGMPNVRQPAMRAEEGPPGRTRSGRHALPATHLTKSVSVGGSIAKVRAPPCVGGCMCACACVCAWEGLDKWVRTMHTEVGEASGMAPLLHYCP